MPLSASEHVSQGLTASQFAKKVTTHPPILVSSMRPGGVPAGVLVPKPNSGILGGAPQYSLCLWARTCRHGLAFAA